MNHDRFTTYNADCLTILDQIPQRLAIVSDPPYGIGYEITEAQKEGRKKSSQKNWGKVFESANLNIKIETIVNDDRPFDPTPFLSYRYLAFFGGNFFADKLPASNGWIVWYKKREGLYEKWSGADCELCWTNGSFMPKVIPYLWMGVAREGQVKVAGGKNASFHPTEKPIVVMQKVIQSLKIPKTYTICDPYMGSGTTGVAALRLGYNFIGCEILEKYYAIENKRLLEVADQPLLIEEEREEEEEEILDQTEWKEE